MPGKHAKLAPSASNRWLACPGSLDACSGLAEKKESEAAREGTRAHQLLEESITKDLSPKSFLSMEDELGIWEPSEEMAHCISNVKDTIYKHCDGASVYSEDTVEIGLHLGLNIDICWGTADIWYVKDTTLVVRDLKYGMMPVDPKGNTQLILYGLGILNALPNKSHITEITLIIDQPRVGDGKPKTHTYAIADFNSLVFDIAQKAKRVFEPDAPRIPGESQCRWCPAKGDCKERLDKAQETIDRILLPVGEALTKGNNVSDEEIVAFLDAEPFLTNLIKDIDKEAYSRSKVRKLPGWKLIAGRNKPAEWKPGEHDTIRKSLSRVKGKDDKAIGLDGVAPRVMISPAKARKLPLTAKYLKLMENWCEPIEKGADKLVPDSDPAPEIHVGPTGFAPVVEQTEETEETELPSFI